MEIETRDKKSGIAVWNEGADNYDYQYSCCRNIVDRVSVLKNFRIDCSDLILEVGAGTGRFTIELAKKVAEVVAVDYSIDSLKINKSRCNCHVVLADLCFLPFRSSVFDNATSIGVFQFIPTWRSRITGLREIRRVLKKNAHFLIAVYNYSLVYANPLLKKFKKHRKQGYRDGTLYYYRFNLSEFRSMLASTFSKIVEIRGILVLTLLQEFLYRIGTKKIALSLEPFFEKTFLSCMLGSHLLSLCQK